MKKANKETTMNVYPENIISRHPAGWQHHWNTREKTQRKKL